MIQKAPTKISDLLLDERNANKGTERGNAMIEQSLRQYGAGRSVLIDKKGRVIAGNKTLENAAAMGLEDLIVVQTDGQKVVAVQRMDLDLAKNPRARELAIADNRTGQVNLEWEPLILGELRTELDLKPFFSDSELDGLTGVPVDVEEDDPGPLIDKAAELNKKWKVERGQIWEIGKHRLMCGDSMEATAVSALARGEKAGLLATDPPYGVGLRLEDNHEASNAAKGISKSYRHFGDISGDDLEGPALQSFLEKCFSAALPIQKHSAAWYLWHA